MLESPPLWLRESLDSRPASLWRYREALGIDRDSSIVTLGEGFTPLIESRFAGRPVQLKLDYLCPSGSYKDRGSAVLLSKLKEWSVSRIIEDSSGNAGASIAAYAALAGIEADIYVPASASAGKIAQIEAYGARLMRIHGSREDTTAAAMAAATNIFYASHNWSPYFLAGMKTAAYEIAEQCAWNPPDYVVLPTGGGGLLAGMYLGFREMRDAGYIARMPRLIAVQAAACAPVYRAWSANLADVAVVEKQPTAAEGISVAKPVRGKAILQAVRDSGGMVCTVEEHEIWETMETLGARGLYVEPTAAAAPAALVRLWERGTVEAAARIVVILTGSGLKATDKIVERQALLAATPV
jgi:threonine synthase